MAGVDLLSLGNPVFVTYALCAMTLLLKTILMSVLTVRQRFKHKNFSFPEDNASSGIKEAKTPHPDVERVRRCHRNDMENVYAFVFIGMFYVTINPSVTVAKILLSLFTGIRLFHTVVFLNAIPQPSRALMFLGNMMINIFMGVSVVIHLSSLL